MEQNYANHTRMVPMYHYVTSALWLVAFIGACINVFHSMGTDSFYSATLIVVILLILASLFWFARAFALKAQDRAIRAEENFRHYVLTGKTLPASLRIGQIVALRFASDTEFPALAQQAAAEKMKGKEIKQAIKQWRPDYHRA